MKWTIESPIDAASLVSFLWISRAGRRRARAEAEHSSIALHVVTPLTPFQAALARFSYTETAKYLRLALGLWIGFALPYLAGYQDTAVALAGSAMLTLALGNSISAARGYFHRRVVSNVLVMPLGTLVIWLTTPYLWLGVLLLPLSIFAIVRLRPSLFQMTSVTVPMTLVLYSGEHIRLLEERLIGVVLGMALGFIIQQLAWPPDHGYRANGLVREGHQQAIDALTQLIAGACEGQAVGTLAHRLRASSAGLKQAHDLLKLDLQRAWGAPHLRRNRHRLPLFGCCQEIFEALANLFEAIDTLHEPFDAIDPRWKSAWLAALEQLATRHRQLAEASDPRLNSSNNRMEPLQMRDLQPIVAALPATDVVTTVYLGHLIGYGTLLCRWSQLLAERG